MRKKNWLAHILLDFLEIFMISSFVFALVYIFIGQLMEVSGNSMYPTYLDKEKIIAEKVSLKFKEIYRGEVIIFQHPDIKEKHLLIKRVIALPGEIFKISGGSVYIDGKKLDEPYLESNILTNEIVNGIIKEGVDYPLDDGSYILLGDNRSQSTDSRYFGSVSKEDIIGRALLVYFPINRIRLVEQR
jgi:signal peptidase I